jgi:hypothetical protein
MKFDFEKPAVARPLRMKQMNYLLKVISRTGRRFFYHNPGDGPERVSQFSFDGRGRLWLTDKYTEKRIYTAYPGPWKYFSDGGTLRDLIRHMRIFIMTGKQVDPSIFGPWPDWLCEGDLWGYGRDMEIVRRAGYRYKLLREDKSEQPKEEEVEHAGE